MRHYAPNRPYSIFSTEDKPQIDKLRRKAQRLGFRIEKSRQGFHSGNLGGLQLVDANRNMVLAGDDFGLTIDQADYWIAYHAEKAAA